MNTHITAPRHFRLYGAVLAMAALLITLLAVTLTVGPAMAQEPRTGDNAEEYDKPYPCSEEAVPDANTAKLIRDGYYAVFDGFWDYEVGHLSNNFCPAKGLRRRQSTTRMRQKNVPRSRILAATPTSTSARPSSPSPTATRSRSIDSLNPIGIPAKSRWVPP